MKKILIALFASSLLSAFAFAEADKAACPKDCDKPCCKKDCSKEKKDCDKSEKKCCDKAAKEEQKK